ncbi:MAG: transglycosylase, partial [Comamonas sp.]
MVHQTIAIKTINASNASSKISPMNLNLLRLASMALIVGTLAACSTTSLPTVDPSPIPELRPQGSQSTPAPITAAAVSFPKSRWLPVAWSELPGFESDALHEAWNAWVKNCERPTPAFAGLCSEVRRLSIANGDEQRAWMLAKFQPY